MKKLFFAMLAMAAFVSCSKENTSFGVEDQVEVTFNVAPNQLQTRAYGDGNTAHDLEWAIYLNDNYSAPLFSGEVKEAFPGDNHTYSFTQTLAVGKSYKVVFWADSQNDPYTIDWGNHTVTLDVRNLHAQDENLDAFYRCETLKVENGTTEKDFYLKRPFAQLNVATADVEDAKKAGLTVSRTSMKVGGVYTKMDLLSGDVVGDPTTLTFSPASIPTGDNQFVTINNNTYSLMSMNYLLVRKSSSDLFSNNGQLSDVTFSVYESQGSGTFQSSTLVSTSDFTNIRLQRNHRTYILGNLLTNDVKFNVVIVDEFDSFDHIENR